MMSFDQIFNRLAKYTAGGGGGLGKYAADELKLHLMSGGTRITQTSLEQCLLQLEMAIERVSPVIMKPTPEGLRVGYGPKLAAGDIFVAAASPRNAVVLSPLGPHTQLTRPSLPSKLTDPGDFWRFVSKTIDAASAEIKRRPDWAPQGDILITALFAQMGAALFSSLLFLADESRQYRLPLIPAVIAVAACEENHAAGGLTMLHLPRSTIVDDAPATLHQHKGCHMISCRAE
jgi:hypothetical protein